MSTATMSTNFQLSMPQDARGALGPEQRQKPAFIQTGSSVRLVPQPAVADLVGLARGASTERLRARETRPQPPVLRAAGPRPAV